MNRMIRSAAGGTAAMLLAIPFATAHATVPPTAPDGSTPVGGGASPDVAVLLERINELEARLESTVAQLQPSDQTWLTEARAGQIRSLVEEVLADADQRVSLQSAGLTAGWDKGFFLASPDGNFRLNVGALLQVRWIYNQQDDSPTGNDSQSGFENARTRLDFGGHIFDPSWIYLVQGQFGNDGGDFELLDAWAGKKLSENWIVLAGQFKVPVVREWTVDDPYQLAVNRSLVNTRLSAGRTQGVALDYRDDMFHFLVSFNDGAQDTGGYNSTWSTPTTAYAFAGRADVKLAGDWAQTNQLTSFRGDPFGLIIGGGAHYQSGESTNTIPRLDLFQWSADVTAYFGGFNLFGSITGRHLTEAVDADIYGAVVQGGAFITDEIELFARYEWGDDDQDGTDDLNLFNVGANWYIRKQAVRLTADFGYAFDSISPFWVDFDSGSYTGWRADSPGADGQWVIRTQLQLFF